MPDERDEGSLLERTKRTIERAQNAAERAQNAAEDARRLQEEIREGKAKREKRADSTDDQKSASSWRLLQFSRFLTGMTLRGFEETSRTTHRTWCSLGHC
jgi:hypothetical protein